MDNTAKKLFKKSFVGGFKREDVANYIAELSSEHMQELDAVKSDLRAATAKNSELESANTELEATRQELCVRVDELSAKVVEGDAAKAELDALKEQYAQLTTEKESIAAELETLKTTLSATMIKISEYQAREQEVNKSKEHIANLEIEAIERSKEIEETTRTKMSNELREHNAYIEKTRKELNDYCDGKYNEIEALVMKISSSFQNTKNAVGDFKVGFKAVVAELAREIDTVSEACTVVENSFTTLVGQCNNMREGE